MPYIKKEQRDKVDKYISALVEAINEVDSEVPLPERYLSHAGILNYCITKLALGVIPVRKYWVIALKSGIFRNVADEYYRRFASVYEDHKIEENGDVYLEAMYGVNKQ